MADRYLFLIIEGAWENPSPESFAEEMAKHEAFMAAVVATGGKVLSGEALQGLETGYSVVPSREGQPAMYSDGPLSDPAADFLSGYYLIEVDTPAIARDLAALCPTGGSIEVRPVWNMEM
ncbi:YciI family protein [Lacisediminihabitans changchengi]|uniref:YCII-related domain-containing protein n=1 Tax=Lacisediminihabitans changchengi TaxID=2787634 RepID=A0A934SK02_9MICO|nr:YciI family protein [Lacisediminihabitans changchengi]MBK4346317.1 hypothetical protein [Lacisediminihabitans changchengi]